MPYRRHVVRRQMDGDGSGEVDFDEFYAWWKWFVLDQTTGEAGPGPKEQRAKRKAEGGGEEGEKSDEESDEDGAAGMNDMQSSMGSAFSLDSQGKKKKKVKAFSGLFKAVKKTFLGGDGATSSHPCALLDAVLLPPPVVVPDTAVAARGAGSHDGRS